MAFAHTRFFTSEPAEALATFLTARAPSDLNHVYFLSGGLEATEAALKLARQYMLDLEGHVCGDPLENGHWIDAANLQAGARLLNANSPLADVVSVEIE